MKNKNIGNIGEHEKACQNYMNYYVKDGGN